MTQHIVSPKTYLWIFASLMVLTAVTVVAASYDMGPFNTVIALTIAAAKTALVVLVFMHLRYSSRLIWLAAFSALLWLVILIGMTLTDFLSRDWIAAPRGW